MTEIPNYYWDTCVFIAHLNDEREQYGHFIGHIRQFLDEARRGKCRIYCSTITLAEIKAKFLKKSPYGTFNDFLADFRGSVVTVAPDPPMMVLASHLRSQRYEKPPSVRELATPDAIHIATAIALQDTYKVPLEAFHTFDAGKSKNPEGGRSMPILGYEGWCASCQDDDAVKKVISLNREKPNHRAPDIEHAQ